MFYIWVTYKEQINGVFTNSVQLTDAGDSTFKHKNNLEINSNAVTFAYKLLKFHDKVGIMHQIQMTYTNNAPYIMIATKAKTHQAKNPLEINSKK